MSDPKSFRSLIERVNAETDVYMVKLPVPKKNLDKVFSVEAIDLHYDTLYKKYVTKAQDTGDAFQFAGAKLHTLFFEQLGAYKSGNLPDGAAKILIDKKFGNFSSFKTSFAEVATSIEGSGWAYLDIFGKIKTIENHKVVSDVALIIDMWEHSYIIDFGADKAEYVNSMWSIINWDIVNVRIK
jgi:superoxide dismutase